METPGDKPRHSVGALILLVIDVLLATCAYLQLAFVVPVFEKMYRDFRAQLPAQTQILFNISNAIMVFHGLGFSLLFCFLLWMIIRTYFVLHRRGDRKKLFACLWIILLSFAVLIGIMTVTMFVPTFRGSMIVGG